MAADNAGAHRGGSPIPILVTPNTALVEVLTNLNARIKAWGYTDNMDGYVAAFKDEFAATKLNEGAGEEWTHEKGAWLREGDMILEQIEVFISDGWMCSLSSRAGAMMWRHLTAVVWKMQYMTVVLQVYLDTEA